MEHEREEDAVVKEGTTEELSDLLGDDSSVAELCAAAHPANQSTEQACRIVNSSTGLSFSKHLSK